MKILHTSDWHLGHTLNGFDRANEHEQFLGWLVEQLEEEQVDALLVAGDVFDQANPSASAQSAYYHFLVEAAGRCPGLQIVIVGGNHDSAARLDAPAEVLKTLRVHVVGGVTRDVDGTLDTSRLLVDLVERNGKRAAVVAAVPFLRRSDLPDDCWDDHAAGLKRVYEQVCEAAKARLGQGEALIATGHLFIMGGQVSEDSERKIGDQQPVPVSIFGGDVAYVALGHLHFAQSVGGRERIRYSGSPIPLSMAEQSYQHEVRLLTVHQGRVTTQRALKVPRAVALHRLKATSKQELEQLVAQFPVDVPPGKQPFVEVIFEGEEARLNLRQELLRMLEGRGIRLVSLRVPLKGDVAVLAAALGSKGLGELAPEAVFSSLYARNFNRQPNPELLTAFLQLMGEAR